MMTIELYNCIDGKSLYILNVEEIKVGLGTIEAQTSDEVYVVEIDNISRISN